MDLMACSSDGTVAYIEFSKDEIGDPMAQNDVVSSVLKTLLFTQLFIQFLLINGIDYIICMCG